MHAIAYPLARLVAVAGVVVVGGLAYPRSQPQASWIDHSFTCTIPLKQPLKEYLDHPPDLSMRAGDQIVRAPHEDQEAARTYPLLSSLGPLHDGVRITILTARDRYRVGEQVRVLHTLEIPNPGQSLWVMGPKAIHGEYVDGIERTPPEPTATIYDGVVIDSPGIDWNYDISTYTFDAPGRHRIQWRRGELVSNTIEIEVY